MKLILLLELINVISLTKLNFNLLTYVPKFITFILFVKEFFLVLQEIDNFLNTNKLRLNIM